MKCITAVTGVWRGDCVYAYTCLWLRVDVNVVKQDLLSSLLRFLKHAQYRIYTKKWCGFPLFTIETAPLFCVYSVYACKLNTDTTHKFRLLRETKLPLLSRHKSVESYGWCYRSQNTRTYQNMYFTNGITFMLNLMKTCQ
jgi:hypothetical protein